jgi:peptidylprolyl isomerase
VSDGVKSRERRPPTGKTDPAQSTPDRPAQSTPDRPARSAPARSAPARATPARSGWIRSRVRSAAPQPTTKAGRRAAAKAARIAAARRRRQTRIAAWVGGVTLVLILAVFLGLRVFDGSPSASASASGSPSSGAAEPGACGAEFPPVPAGADQALCTKPTVTAGTGALTELKVTPVIEGTGAAAAAGQSVTVNYVGVTYATGVQFDASWDKGQPFTFTLGQGGVIPGWDQGLAGVKVGSRVQLDIPSNLAYGDNPEGGQPAGALRFVVDLLAAS